MAIALSLMPTIAAPAEADPRIHLICENGPSAFFCRALAAALEADFGPVVVTQNASDTVSSVQFVTQLRGADVLTGHLTWRRADGTSGIGPTLTLSASDADLNEAMLDRFAVDLLRFSQIPL